MRAGEPSTSSTSASGAAYEEEGLTSDNDPPNVSVGPNSANPHYQPDAKTHSPIRRGDFVLFDVWAKLKQPGSIYADQTWVGYVGDAVPEEHQKIFRIVAEARDAATNFVRAALRDGKVIGGAQGTTFPRRHQRAGFGSIHARTGHSIGREVTATRHKTTLRRRLGPHHAAPPPSPSSPASPSKASSRPLPKQSTS